MAPAPTIVWFRTDLRLGDNTALACAAQRGGTVIPVFVWAPEEETPWAAGAASNWWLHQSLAALDTSLREKRSRIVIRRGPTLKTLKALAGETGARRVVWNRRYEPAVSARDARVEAALRAAGLETETFQAGLLFEPGAITNRQGNPFRVFTPFWKTCLGHEPPRQPRPEPSSLRSPRRWPVSLPLDALDLEPRVDWAGGIRAMWAPGEAGACKRLRTFLDGPLATYRDARDRPGLDGTSCLSPHLRFGEISPSQVWYAVQERMMVERATGTVAGGEAFLRQLHWREFAWHLLHHEPHTTGQPLRPEFAAFPWSPGEDLARAWKKGMTGYPYVDAGMRQLWSTGWMHNRVRMAAASFLVKDLLIPWQDGARWFWDTLVDADLANNTFGWQWVAGCGADAAPFFRIFNPVTQGEKYDPLGEYVRRWVPELARLPNKLLCRPWEASPALLAEAGVTLGTTYPLPVVDHAKARARALAAYHAVRQKGRLRRIEPSHGDSF